MSDEGVTLPEGWVIDDQEMEWDYHQPPWDGVTVMMPTPESTGRFKLTIHGHRAEVPPRSEYPCQSVTVTAGCTSVREYGVVLVPAHSLRSGDEVEWAPGDWRAIDWVRVDEHWVGIDAGDWTIGLRPVDLVAVRRSGVTG